MSCPEAAELPVYDSDLRAHPALEELAGLWRFRDLVWQLIRAEMVARYKRSYLGVVWTLLNPMGTALVLVLALSRMFGSAGTYGVHVLSGLMVWNFWAYGTQTAIQRSLAGSREMPGVYVPRTAYAVASIGTALVNLVLATVPVAVLLACCGQLVHPSVVLMPVTLTLLSLFALGVSLVVASLSIRFSDVAQAYVMALPAWLYLTPIIYPAAVLDPAVRALLPWVNPLHGLVELYRMPFNGGVWPGLAVAGSAVLGTLVVLVAGWVAFSSQTDELGRQA